MIGLTQPARQGPDPMLFVSALLALADIADPEVTAEVLRMAKEAGDRRRAALAEAEAGIALMRTALVADEARLVEREEEFKRNSDMFAGSLNKREASINAKAEKTEAKLAEITAMADENKAALAEMRALQKEIDAHNDTIERREAKVAAMENTAANKMAEAEAMRTAAAAKLEQISAIVGG